MPKKAKSAAGMPDLSDRHQDEGQGDFVAQAQPMFIS
jgi:hypothetical protein